jgi:hypothetical protein
MPSAFTPSLSGALHFRHYRAALLQRWPDIKLPGAE